MSLEQGVILVYLRRNQPTYFVIPRPMQARPEKRAEYARLLTMYNRVTEQGKPLPGPDDPLPEVPLNALRRDVNETLTRLKTEGVPMLLTRYDDVLGFVVPVPTGSGGMTMVRQLAIWYNSGDVPA